MDEHETLNGGDGAAPGPLESLAQEAESLSQGGPPGGGPPGTAVALAPEPPPRPTNAEILGQIFISCRETVCWMASIESPREQVPDDKCIELGKVWGACADHYGISMHDKMGKYGPLIAAVGATVAMLGPAFVAIRKEIQTMDRARPVTVTSTAKPGHAEPVPPAPPAAPPPMGDGVIKTSWPE